MQSSDQAAKDFVRAVLGSLSFESEEVRTANAPRPDLVAHHGDEFHFIEVKEKLSARDYSEARTDFETGLPYLYFDRTTGYRNRLAGILHKATRQLQFQPPDVEKFTRIVWFVATGPDANLDCRQLIASLFGSRRVGFCWPTGHWSHLPCYYARNSVFFKYRETLDGVVVGDNRSGKLCLNDHSSRYELLRDSLLAKRFQADVIDPLAEEGSGHAFRIVGDIQRDSDSALVNYLNASYNIRAAKLFDLEHHQAEVLVPEATEIE